MSEERKNLWSNAMKDKKQTGPVGLGDTIKQVTNALGIKQCGGCKRRQEKLNKLFPYKK